MQLAKVQGDIATLQARIALKQGLPIGTPSIAANPRGFPNADLIIPAGTMLSLALVLPLSIAWSRRILRRAPKPTPIPNDVTMRLERIEQAVDTIAIEVERISEGQRFVTKIMAERPATNAAAADASSDRSASQMRQPLALGAGPMEPIVVGERDAVRERVTTPH